MSFMEVQKKWNRSKYGTWWQCGGCPLVDELYATIIQVELWRRMSGVNVLN